MQCPRCGQMFAPQGLSGHLRLVHKLDKEDAREVMIQAAQLPDELPDDESDGPGQKRSLPVAAVVAGAGVIALGVLLALRDPNVVACTRCGTKLDVTQARAQGAQVVTCPSCQALVQLP